MAGLAILAATGVTLLTGAAVTALPPFDLRVTVPQTAGPAPPAIAAPAPSFATRSEPERARGPWRIQVGAFAAPGAAEAQLRTLSASVPALAGSEPMVEAAGRLNRARFGGFADEAQAAALCARIAQAGSGCYVVPPGP